MIAGWKSLPTPYRGIEFRSRLEARWAMFLDLVNVKWFYEYESFNLDGVYYVPDFWLPEIKSSANYEWIETNNSAHCRPVKQSGLWLEIKPPVQPSPEEQAKCGRLASHTNTRVVMQCGEPGWWLPEPHGHNGGASSRMFFPSADPDLGKWGSDDTYLPCACINCGNFGFEYEGRSARICRHDDSDRYHSYDCGEIVRAAERAMFNRFDLGRQIDQ